MKLTQIKFGNRADTELKALKARTGITPNLLCRIGFCLSVEDASGLDPDTPEFAPESNRVIDRHVLLGPYDALFVGLIKERLHSDGLDPTDEDLLASHFRAHVHRGVHLLFKSAKSLEAFGRVFPPPATSQPA